MKVSQLFEKKIVLLFISNKYLSCVNKISSIRIDIMYYNY